VTCRWVSGLVEARPCGRPKGMPVSRPRGTKAQGLAYERKLASALPLAKHGQWFEFVDQNGNGYCQPDLFLDLGEVILVLECKLRWTLEGHMQVQHLYKPVLERAFGKPVFGGVVCKLLVAGAPVVLARDLGQFGELARREGVLACLHWMGNPATLWPSSRSLSPLHLAPGLARV